MNTGVPGQDFPGSDLGMAVQVLENRHGRETIHSMGAGFTLVFVKLAPFGTGPLSTLFQISTSWGGAGKTFNWEVNFKEFARVELWDGQRTKVAARTHTWFRISDYCDWHFYFKSQWGTSNWIDNSSATDVGHPNP